MGVRRRIAVLGTMANAPYAGMAWMHGQFLMGLAHLGHEVSYVEMTTAWPYHPIDLTTTDDPSYALSYLARIMKGFGLSDRWAYRAAYADGAWYGPLGTQAVELVKSADAVLNITGSTTLEEIGFPCHLVYIGTDPVLPELRIANGDVELLNRLAGHEAHFTYGENIGNPDCPVPPLPFRTYPTRQPIVTELWRDPPPPRLGFTTVMNWSVSGYDVEYQGEVYTWSKHHEFMKIVDLPRRTNARFEVAMGLSGVSPEVKQLLHENGWSVVDAYQMSLDPWPYRDYVRASQGEFSVAKDMVVRLRSGWFSERSACYLAAGRPVIAQDTAFSRILPTGEGLFAFQSAEDILAAIAKIAADYKRHSRAALAVAEEYFKAEKVLGAVLSALGL
jgi:hypothetical protein